jgi:hypothetical protein
MPPELRRRRSMPSTPTNDYPAARCCTWSTPGWEIRRSRAPRSSGTTLNETHMRPSTSAARGQPHMRRPGSGGRRPHLEDAQQDDQVHGQAQRRRQRHHRALGVAGRWRGLAALDGHHVDQANRPMNWLPQATGINLRSLPRAPALATRVRLGAHPPRLRRSRPPTRDAGALRSVIRVRRAGSSTPRVAHPP